jgi:ATP-dependent protease ClpP protease subunit
MGRFHKDDIDRYFDYGVFLPERMLYVGSTSEDDEGKESGVNYEMAEYFIKGITFLQSISDKAIVINLNNMGGDWYHGMAMYDAIRACRCHVTINVFGSAMSMASIILQAADTRIVAPNATIMIHDGDEELIGSPRTVVKWADYVKHISDVMYEIYLERMREKQPKIKRARIRDMCVADTIFTAQEAVDAGLADSVMHSLEFAKEEEE